MAKITKLATTINLFDNYQLSHQRLVEETFKDFSTSISNDNDKTDIINKLCEKIPIENLMVTSLKNCNRYHHIALLNYYDFRRSEDNSLIYMIDKYDGKYYISTGIYCGVINFGEKMPTLEIRTGYSDLFLKRMLNFCCGIYADTYSEKGTSENESIYSLLAQYLFLISLRKVVTKAIPKKYVLMNKRGYNINGNINVEEYINRDLLLFDNKVSFQYQEQLEIQSIIDTLHVALKCCKIDKHAFELSGLTRYENYIASLYSGVRPTKKTIKSILKEKCLSNSLYADYKKPLEYARILIENNDVCSGGLKTTSSLSGILIDASFLWEMYLYNLMKIHLSDWDIQSQCEISFYENTFFSKKNYPDFVLRNKNNGKVFVIDAKFKRMNFDGADVDNEDVRQLHSYSYYYSLIEGNKFSGAALIYPTKKLCPEPKKTTDDIFGIKGSGAKFGVFAVKDPSDGETISKNELLFIKELKDFIEYD